MAIANKTKVGSLKCNKMVFIFGKYRRSLMINLELRYMTSFRNKYY